MVQEKTLLGEAYGSEGEQIWPQILLSVGGNKGQQTTPWTVRNNTKYQKYEHSEQTVKKCYDSKFLWMAENICVRLSHILSYCA